MRSSNFLAMIESPDTDERVRWSAIKEWLERDLGKVQ
jgi:hypothetical protein